MRAVVYFGSREIYKDFPGAVMSLLEHTQVDKVYALIEDDKLPYGLPVEYITFPEGMFNSLNTKTEWKQFGCARAAMTKLFPDLDTILSIDLDTRVEQDISDLFDINLDGYYFAAVREPGMTERLGKPYYSAGVCLLNLKLMRATGKDDEIIEALNTHRYAYVSQDCMNELCAGKILDLPSEYNACVLTAPTGNVKIRHFVGVPDWREKV